MPSLPTLLLCDPAWCAMDATARGFHTQLLLLAAPTGGRVPDDDRVWRAWLGLPEGGDVPALLPACLATWLNGGTPDRLAELGGQAALWEHYWVHRWRPMLRRAWQPAGEGQLTCAAAQALAQDPVASPMGPSPTVTVAPRAKRRAAPRSGRKAGWADVALDHVLSPTGPVGEGGRCVGPLPDRLTVVADVAAQWHVPLARAQRLSVWTVGLAALAAGGGSESHHRSLLASLIRQFGERRVAAAVGELSGRASAPADPRAFLLGLLRRDTQGNVAAQQARALRASVPL